MMSNIKKLGLFKLYMMTAISLCVLLLFFIAFRDFIIPYRVNAYLNGSVYEYPEPAPLGERRLQVEIK